MDLVFGLSDSEFNEYFKRHLDEFIFFDINNISKDYKKLLEDLFSASDSFLLVVRTDSMQDNSVKKLLKQLNPNRIDSLKSNHWSNTFTWGEPANLYFFKASAQTYSVLLSVSKSLSDWQPPNLPEDLCFLKNNKYIFMTCIHEHMCFVSKEYLSILGLEQL